ncbi:hypothetical protein C8R44DRAFT_860165 [Mycena epipterygia]|nr:hypothetical protein C8R44DRAFT_860165 [Mycena epipterygia]
MRTDMALDRASLITLVLEMSNIGALTTLFSITVHLKKRIDNTNRLLFSTLCLIWVLSITVRYWCITLYWCEPFAGVKLNSTRISRAYATEPQNSKSIFSFGCHRGIQFSRRLRSPHHLGSRNSLFLIDTIYITQNGDMANIDSLILWAPRARRTQMRTDIALDRASLIALVLETFIIGAFTTLFSITVYLILKKRINNTNRLLLPTLGLIWVLSMTHWIIDITRAVNAFINTPEGALAYYEDVSNPLETAKTAVYVTVTMTGDFFLIYRCFIIWNRRWSIVILPVLLWLGTGVTGYGATHNLLLARQGGVFFQALAPWITSFFAMSLTLNIICTTSIAYRILRTRMVLHKDNAQNSRVYSALIIFLESAAIYSSSLLALLVVYVLNFNAQYIALDMTASLIGVTFSMILLRLAVTNSTATTEQDFLASLRERARANNSYPLTNVTVSRLVEVSGTESFDQGVSGKSTF